MTIALFLSGRPSPAQNYNSAAGYTSITSGTNGSSFAGVYQADTTTIDIYANRSDTSSVPQTVAFHTFTTDGSGIAANALPLQVGQSFTVTLALSGSRGINGNSIGFSLNNGATFTGTNNYNTGSRFEYSFTGGANSAAVYDSGTQTAGLPGYTAFAGGLTYTFTLVSTNEYNFSVSGGGANYNVNSLGGTSGSAINSFSLFNRGYNNNDALFSAVTVSNVSTISLTANTGETKTVAGQITNGAVVNGIQKLGVGVVNLTANNTFTGTATVSGGTLNANATGGSKALGGATAVVLNTGGTLLTTTAQQFNATTPATISLAGGLLNTNGTSQTLGALTLSANSTIDLGNGASILSFGGTSTRDGGLLTISNWSGSTSGGGTDQIFVANTLSQDFLSNIQFTGFGLGAMELGNGEIVPVPEPSAFLGGAVVAAGVLVLMARSKITQHRRA